MRGEKADKERGKERREQEEEEKEERGDGKEDKRNKGKEKKEGKGEKRGMTGKAGVVNRRERESKERGRGSGALSLAQSPLKVAQMVSAETMPPLRPEGDKSSPMILLGHQQNLAL